MPIVADEVVSVRNGFYHLKVDQLESILKNSRVKDLPVVVISVAGAFRGGKSFLLNFFLKYLKSPPESRADGSWLGADDSDAELEGFGWRGGSDRNTTGIVIWPEAIPVKLTTGEEIAVILMDTQGTFDSESTVRDSSTIFALSSLVSSTQIYNISTHIREDDLQNLQFFTEYGRLLKDNSNETAFQALVFLVRDWPTSNATKYPYGSRGGNLYLEEKLKVKPEQQLELKNLRHHIRASFGSTSCFLMPHPGLTATEDEFFGQNKDLTPKFKTYVKELTSYIFGKDMLKPKVIGGEIVKTGDLFAFFTAYLKVFNSNELPTATTIMQATAEAGLRAAFEEARRLYETGMDRDCGVDKPSVPAHDLKDLHKKHVAQATAAFKTKKKMGSKDEAKEYLAMLEEEFKERLAQFVKVNVGKILQVMSEAKKVYEEKILQIKDNAELCVHTLDLWSVHKEAVQVAIQLFDVNRRCFSNKEDTEKADFFKGFDKEYEYLQRINEQNNISAVNELRLQYTTTMLRKCSDDTPLSEEQFEDAHSEAMSAALVGFAQKRNHPDAHDQDIYKNKLIEMIRNSCDEIKEINKSKNRLALQAAIKRYEDYMKSAWDAAQVCLHPADLDNEQEEGERLALTIFRPQRVSTGKVFFDIRDEDEQKLHKAVKDRFKEIEDLNNSSNEAAVQNAVNFYTQKMEYVNVCWTNYWFFGILIIFLRYLASCLDRTLKIGMYHDESKSSALKVFYKARRESNNTAPDRFLENLQSVSKKFRIQFELLDPYSDFIAIPDKAHAPLFFLNDLHLLNMKPHQ